MFDDDKTFADPGSLAVATSLLSVVNTTSLVGEDAATKGPIAKLRQNLGRLIRYSATSVVALGTSEITLVALYATRTVGVTTAAVIANLAGTVPSYFLSRYWIWTDSDRRRVGRQVVLYWVTSIIAITITSLATGAIAKSAPSGHSAHVIAAGVGFLGVNMVLWVAKYVVYQKIIFRTPQLEASAA